MRHSIYPLPLRLRAESEPAPGRQTAEMLRVERTLLEAADTLGRALGLDRRQFLRSGCGMAAAFVALNSVFGPVFAVDPAEAADPEAAAERTRPLRDQLIVDVQTHFVSPRYRAPRILGLREMAKAWNPLLRGKQTLEEIRFENYFREVFLGSDTGVAVLSNAPADRRERWFLSNEEALRARETLQERAGSRRLLAHAVFTPGQPGWLDQLEKAAELRPDGWKGYSVGSPSEESRWPWRLDDEKLAYPAYEKMVKAGITTVAIHKGLLPPGYEKTMPKTWRYGSVMDLPRAARDWPQLKFVIYHSALRSGGIPSALDRNAFEEKGTIPWVTELAAIPEKHGVSNVYAELGSVFAMTAVSAPRYCAGLLGTLVRGLGEDKVVWGTDSVWYGSPQWQIEALRRLEIPADLQRKFGFQPLGAADGPVKSKIFAGNAAALYAYSTDSLKTDKLATMKAAGGAAEGRSR
ncbi:MAG: amidohydrolase family protein [Deltaproteobacteria bacterium]|nr:amidohydrolase family protein [Deltaproteobacteria bacterium]